MVEFLPTRNNLWDLEKCVRENFGHIQNVLALAYVFMTDEVENVNQNISLCRDRNFDRQVCSKSGPIFDAINQLCQYQFQADCISKPVIGESRPIWF